MDHDVFPPHRLANTAAKARAERFTVTIEREHAHFSAGHFLIFPDGGSEPLHGHNYRVEVEVSGRLRRGGLVIDFLNLMPIVQDVCKTLDSRTILPTRNGRLKVKKSGGRVEARIRGKTYVFPSSDVVLLNIENSSCELIAGYVNAQIVSRLRRGGHAKGLETVRVAIEEAPGEMATCSVRVSP